MFGEVLTDKLFVYLLSDRGQEMLKNNKRSYGDALDKFEPGDLNDCLCPNQRQFARIDDRDARGVIDVARNDEQTAIRMSNDLVERMVNPRVEAEAERCLAYAGGFLNIVFQ
jgi:adenine-specific DNA-methyltransferase